jgi:tRNA dimethylallyltransferase
MAILRVVALVGLTGTGKTDLAVEAARRTGAEIISCDSMQVYRGLDIGTAKPSRALQAEVPHHLIDVVEPDDPMSAGRFADLARRAAADAIERGKPVILCGGTGLYARAFAGGLIHGVRSDAELREELENLETDELYAELGRCDPEAAARIPAGDRIRILRAVEVARLSGRSLSDQHREHQFQDRPFEVHWLALDMDRKRLAERIERRVKTMFRAGLLDEVRALRAAGYASDLKSMQAIGYREAGLHLDAQLSLDEAQQRISTATRRYAKRQRTWFRAEPGVRWLDAEQTAISLSALLDGLAAC